MKKDNFRMLAFDFGGSGGRAVLGNYAGGKLSLEVIHSFPIEPVAIGRRLYWDIFALFKEIKKALFICKNKGTVPDSLGIDTWGNSFGLLDIDGDLLMNPMHYRDPLGPEYMDKAHELVNEKEMFYRTGIMPHRLNAIYQLYGLYRQKPRVMASAKRFLNTPDLLNYFLTGEAVNELTVFSTTQCLDVPNKRPADDMLAKLGIDPGLFASPVQSGAVLGNLRPELADELGLDTAVVTVAGHDTASAIASVHWMDNFLFISSGTFSVVGVEIDKPYLTDDVYKREFTQEANAIGQIQLKRNITGLWMLQECRRVWKSEGSEYSWDELSEMSEKAGGEWIIDTTEPRFAALCNMPKLIKEACMEKFGTAPASPGEICRTIEISLAETYKKIIGQLEEITGDRYDRIFMVGGGIRNKQLCRFTAERTGLDVTAGPVEAAVYGNLSMQMTAMGLTGDLAEASLIMSGMGE